MKYKRLRYFNSALVIRKALKRSKSDIKWTDKIMAIFTMILTFGTLALFYEAFSQTKEVKDEFIIANTPYLQLAKVIDSIHPGQAPIIAYSIENLGKVPCKIMWCEIGDSVSNQPNPMYPQFFVPMNLFASPPNRKGINMYSIDGSPYMAQYTTGYPLNDKVYNDLKSKQSYLYFYGAIDYVNQMSSEERMYEFSAKIIQNPSGAIEMTTNDNMSIKDYEWKHRKIVNH
jgi:hypothetical protein